MKLKLVEKNDACERNGVVVKGSREIYYILGSEIYTKRYGAKVHGLRYTTILNFPSEGIPSLDLRDIRGYTNQPIKLLNYMYHHVI